MNFQEFKTEILKRAKKQDACTDEYKKAYKSESFAELFKAISDNFHWCCRKGVIDVPLLNQVGLEICHENNFWVNESSNKGFMIADSAKVEAWGSATVEAWDSATVRAWGSATVRAWGSAKVEAWGSATVEASDSATVEAWGSATVRAWGSATVEASDSATVEAWDSATVEASGSVYIDSRNSIEHKISDKVILRYYNMNIIKFGENINLK